MTHHERVLRLASVLKLTPTARTRVEPCVVGGRRRWWLLGCIEGDQALPQTASAHTLPEALDMAEAWFASEIDGTGEAGTE